LAHSHSLKHVSLAETDERSWSANHKSAAMFMDEHFAARTVIARKEYAISREFASKYFAPNFDWTGSIVSAAWSEGEHVIQISEASDDFEVITAGIHMRLKYHLKPRSQGWLIREVDRECVLCCRNGRKSDCFLCGGTMWESDQPPGDGSESGKRPKDPWRR
jgi:hypothetical protein